MTGLAVLLAIEPDIGGGIIRHQSQAIVRQHSVEPVLD
jgi:hypothetical protein